MRRCAGRHWARWGAGRPRPRSSPARSRLLTGLPDAQPGESEATDPLDWSSGVRHRSPAAADATAAPLIFIRPVRHLPSKKISPSAAPASQEDSMFRGSEFRPDIKAQKAIEGDVKTSRRPCCVRAVRDEAQYKAQRPIHMCLSPALHIMSAFPFVLQHDGVI